MSEVFVSYLPAAVMAISAGSAGGVQKASYHVRNATVIALRNIPKRTGHVYKIPNTSRYYTASAPREYPALATGQLRGSFRVKMIGPSSYVMGTNVKYAEPLEKIRPFMKDIFNNESDEMKLIIRGAGDPLAGRWF